MNELKIVIKTDKINEALHENENYKKFLQLIKDWEADPAHWTNGKRHMHGLPVLRGAANRKDRFFPSLSVVAPMIEEILNDILPKKTEELFNTFAECKSFIINDNLVTNCDKND